MAGGSKKKHPLPGMAFVAQFVKGSHSTGGFHMSARPLLLIMAALIIVFFFFAPRQTIQNFNLLIFLAPLWVPAALVQFGFIRFVQFRRADFLSRQPFVLLELLLPRDTKKTPLAMETVLSNLNFSNAETTWWKKYFKGGVRPWWSFEIVAVGGQVRFYIWTRVSWRRVIESAFYAQYPGIELIEAEDYSRIIDPSDTSQHEMWGEEFILSKLDPYPIKTYVEYELDRPGAKPEEQVDPLAQVIELLGSIGPQEQFWFQIMFRLSRDEKYGSKYTWRDEAKELIKELRKETIHKRSTVDPVTGEIREVEGFPSPTKGQAETIASIERNTAKLGFDVGIRALYSARRGSFHVPMVTLLINMMKPFNNETWNTFKLAELFSGRFNDYPWEDRGGHHKQHYHELLTHYYRRRAYFHSPYAGPWMVLSSEELATLFHVPSSTVETPSLPRIQSATSGAPANLPV